MSILAAAGGAAKGLDDVLLRMLRQQQMEEQARSNRAQEEHATKSLEETSALRRATQEATAFSQGEARRIQEESRKAAQQGQMRDDIRASLDDLMPGVMITPETRNRAVESGAAVPERFKPQVMPEDFVGPIQEGEPQRGEVASYLLEGQDKAAAQTPANAQVQTVSYQGKPVEAIFDPRARTFTYRGKDITNEVGHYEKPPAPDRVLIQTGQGYMPRAEAAQILGKGGDVPLATTSSTRSMTEGAQMIRPHVPELANLAKELDRRGLFGPIMGRMRDLAVKFGTTGSPEQVQAAAEELGNAIASDPTLNTDELAGQFATTLGLMTSGMGRVHGGARGGGSIQMINYLKTLLSGTTSLPMFVGRLNAIDSYLKTYAEGPTGGGGAQAPAAAPPVEDIYQQYLNRTRTARP